jgi:predicted nucleic acid-binding protein
LKSFDAFGLREGRLGHISARVSDSDRAAILLAERLNADVLLLDEKAARTVASLRGLHLSGTLGILADAGRRKLVDLPQVVAPKMPPGRYAVGSAEVVGNERNG